MTYTLIHPEKPTFEQKGLSGFQFPTKNKDVEVYFVDVEKGHDKFIISKKITHMYYILEGTGFFIINNKQYDITPGMLVEVPPDVEFCFSGKMKLLLIMNPPFFPENEEIIKKNPDVND